MTQLQKNLKRFLFQLQLRAEKSALLSVRGLSKMYDPTPVIRNNNLTSSFEHQGPVKQSHLDIEHKFYYHL